MAQKLMKVLKMCFQELELIESFWNLMNAIEHFPRNDIFPCKYIQNQFMHTSLQGPSLLPQYIRMLV